MSLINTNYNYLQTMNMRENSPLVGMVVSVYYLGCAAGAVVFSALADRIGRKRGMFACVVAASVGNFVMCVAGFQDWESKLVNWLMGTRGDGRAGLATMFLGRIIMGLGVGGIDSVVPTYSSELSEADGRGSALAKEFQMNILGLNMAYGINLGVSDALVDHEISSQQALIHVSDYHCAWEVFAMGVEVSLSEDDGKSLFS